MEYTFQFGEVFADYPELLSGAALTLYLSLGAMAIGLVVGTLGALALDSGGRILRGAVRAYVEAIRNTPFLVQLFMVFFALPEIGIGLTGNQAALVAMSLNLGAYATEIIRAGAEGVGQGQIEAARALGLRPLQIFRRIILFQALLSGRADMLGCNHLQAMQLIRDNPALELERKLVLSRQFQGITIRRNQLDLLQWINTWLYYVKNNGELNEINRKWFGEDLPPMPTF